MYKENKEDTCWSMEKFNDYINENVKPNYESMETDWVYNTLTVSLLNPLFNLLSVERVCVRIGSLDLSSWSYPSLVSRLFLAHLVSQGEVLRSLSVRPYVR